MVDPNFTINNVAFGTLEFAKVVQRAARGEIPKGSAIIYEEVGVGVDSRNWSDEQNIEFTHILQTFRPLNLFLLNTVPDLTMAEKRLSQMATGLIECKKVNHSKQFSISRFYDPVKYNPKNQQWMKRSIGFQRASPNGLLRTFYYGDVHVGKPSNKLNDAYLLKRKEYADNLIDGVITTLEATAFKKENPTTPKTLTPEQLKDMANKVILDREKFVRTEAGVGLTRFDLAAVQAEFGIGQNNAKIVKSIARKRFEELGFKVEWR